MSKAPVCEKHNIPKRPRSDGTSFRCSECKAEKSKERYQANREAILAAYRDRYEHDPKFKKKVKERARAHHLTKNYGITPDEYDELLRIQKGKCAICRKKPIDEKHKFGVDHDHETGRVRGLLCKRCNLVLGNALDDRKILRAAANYLEPSSLSPASLKILSDWSADEFYVYIRPMTSRFIDRSKKHKLYWVVSVEYRRVEGMKTFRGEGYDLNEVLAELAERVPRRKEIQPGYVGQQVTEHNAGYLMSKKAKVKKTEPERPRKRTKPAKKKK